MSLTSAISKAILKLWGFKITGIDPSVYPKKIYAIVPHTSNWDFPLGVLVRSAMQLKLQFLAKDSLFKPGIAWFFKALGGIPVDRSKNQNFVDATVEIINRNEVIAFALAPEGTRKKVKDLKSGFYWIAAKSNIPLILVKFDWEHKVVDFAPPFPISGNYNEDLQKIRNHFKGVVGKVPENSFV